MAFPLSTAALISAFLIGILSAYLAYRKGRNLYLWFFLGFVFGIFGILAIFFAPSEKKKPLSTPIPVKPEPAIQGPKDKFWYYLDPVNEQHGPMSHDALTCALKDGKVTPSTFVWHEDLAEWKPLKEMLN